MTVVIFHNVYKPTWGANLASVFSVDVQGNWLLSNGPVFPQQKREIMRVSIEVHSLTHSTPTKSAPPPWGLGCRQLTCVRSRGGHVGWQYPACLRLRCRREAEGPSGSWSFPCLTLTRHSSSTWAVFSLEEKLLVSSIFYKHPEDFLSCSFCSVAPLHKNQCIRLGDWVVCIAHSINVQSIFLENT